jgi:hypothetical protein
MSTENIYLPNKLKDMETRSLLGGAVCLGIMLLSWILGVANFYQGWLIGWLFALGFAGGGLIILCVHNLAAGGWGYLLRRIGEAAALTLTPLMLLFLPIMFSLNKLYPWAILDENNVSVYASDPVIGLKLHYLNHGFMWIRFLVIALLWTGGARLFAYYSRKQDETGDIVWRQKMRFMAGPMALIYILTITIGSVDWVMALEPAWFSSIFGVMLAAGHMLSILSFGIVMLSWLSTWEPVKSHFTLERQHDLGKLLFAFTVFWTYIEVSQFIIYWHPNLPEEITWYMNRQTPTYNGLSWFLFMSQFVLPFLVLLSRGVKRNRKALYTVAFFLIAVRAVDMFWMVSPSIYMPISRELYPVATKAMSGSPYHILDVIGVAGFGLIWFGLFLRNFRSRPLLPVNDPFFSLGTVSKESHA